MFRAEHTPARPVGANGLQARYSHGPGIDEPLEMQRDLDLSGGFDAAEARSVLPQSPHLT
jgi:hypothetical protein